MGSDLVKGTTESNNGWEFMGQMMGNSRNVFVYFQLHMILAIASWIFVLAVLFALFRYLWKKGGK
jgi:hypothetical protein